MTVRPLALVSTSSKNDKPVSGTRSRRFPFAGSIPEGAIYVEREADRVLPVALAAGEFCHVFGPRQLGKSSLRARVTKKLKAQGIRCASIDMMGLGSSATEEQWFYGLVEEIADKLGLDEPLAFWQEHERISPARRWGAYLRHIVRREIVDRRVVILLDEVEAVRLVSFPTDDFFLILRELFEARSQEEYLQRLAICLLGVTVPDDLLQDNRATPFNISRRVRLDDFTRAELDGLAVGLDDLGTSSAALLDAVFAWTDGHPYMTMRTCEALYQRGSIELGQEHATVDEIVQDVFITHAMDDANLRYASDRFSDAAFDKPTVPLMEKVLLLRKLLDGERVVADLESPVQMELILCGMVKGVGDGDGEWVRIRNRIFATAFDAKWLQSRGDRRYLGGAIWKWRESGKNTDYLLRGDALIQAVSSRDPRLWTEEEREFLVEGLVAEKSGKIKYIEFSRSIWDTIGDRARRLADLGITQNRPLKLYTTVFGIFAWIAALAGVLLVTVAISGEQPTIARVMFFVAGLFFIIAGIVVDRQIRPIQKAAMEAVEVAKGLKQSAASNGEVDVAIKKILQSTEQELTTLREHLARLSPAKRD